MIIPPGVGYEIREGFFSCLIRKMAAVTILSRHPEQAPVVFSDIHNIKISVNILHSNNEQDGTINNR